MATITHKVVWGDTLSELAVRYGTTVDAIAKLNNIKNVNLIYVGQVLYISGKPSSEESNKPSSSNSVTITAFGLQSNTDQTVFIAWNWDKSHTKEYEVQWDYTTGDSVWFTGSRENVNSNATKTSTYTAPSNAKNVRCRVKPISTTYEKNEKEVNYWTANWSSYKSIYLDGTHNYTPPTPPTPKLTVSGYTLTCKCENIPETTNTGSTPNIEFEIIEDDKRKFYIGTTKISYNTATYSCSITAGHNYKARARIKQGTLVGDWSAYSSLIQSQPSAPGSITTCKATSSTSVQLAWSKISSAQTYTIEYAIKKEYLEGSNATTKIDSIETTQYEVTGLQSGERYFFRVRSVNESGTSGWSSIVSVIIGTKPIAPTTWSSTTTAISGEKVTLFWLHNTEDASNETKAELEIYYDSQKTIKTITKTTAESEAQTTSQYDISTTNMTEGSVIKWRVRTAGITGEYGEWSVQRTVDVYAPPVLSLEITDAGGTTTDEIYSFPFYIKGYAGPVTQTPVSFHVTITSNESYETIDEIGRIKMVTTDDMIYSEYFDISHDLNVKIEPKDVDLQGGISYKVQCIVAMNSGLTAENTRVIDVLWKETDVDPNAEIIVDRENVTVNVRPFCEYYPYYDYEVVKDGDSYIKTENMLATSLVGYSVDNAFTMEGYIVYEDENGGGYFCKVKSLKPKPVENLTFAVYRREFDGSFTEISTNIKSGTNTFVTDPHPSLDFARYRIVAISDKTGSVSFTDLPGYPVDEKAVIIQWDEEWSNFKPEDEGAIIDPTWSGSMLRLPYNIDVADNSAVDVSLINYIGREHPVSYYGTQLGSTSTWNVAIPKDDVNTLYALRRLATWLGDVYVREPSGSGYWASIAVSFKQTHRELTIPVTLNIKRVEGGV